VFTISCAITEYFATICHLNDFNLAALRFSLLHWTGYILADVDERGKKTNRYRTPILGLALTNVTVLRTLHGIVRSSQSGMLLFSGKIHERHMYQAGEVSLFSPYNDYILQKKALKICPRDSRRRTCKMLVPHFRFLTMHLDTPSWPIAQTAQYLLCLCSHNSNQLSARLAEVGMLQPSPEAGVAWR
jgi:hypothetical protein